MDALGKQIGARIRALRHQQGLTLEQLSEMSGIPPESISRAENGRTLPSIRSLARLAKGLGVPLVALVQDGPEAPTEASAEALPAEVRGLALLLAGSPPRFIEKIRRIVEVLLDAEAPERG